MNSRVQCPRSSSPYCLEDPEDWPSTYSSSQRSSMVGGGNRDRKINRIQFSPYLSKSSYILMVGRHRRAWWRKMHVEILVKALLGWSRTCPHETSECIYEEINVYINRANWLLKSGKPEGNTGSSWNMVIISSLPTSLPWLTTGLNS